jgi:single-stranded-DNA-specific exonuclease
VILHNVSADGALEADRKSGCRVFNFSKELNAIVAKVSKGIVASLDYGELMVYAFNELWFSNQAKVRDRLWQYCTFVALGSVADIVPADGENRILISCGLRSMEQTAHPGLSMLIERINQAKKVQKGGINTRRIGWDIAPLLNAPGRMGKSQLTAEFLLEENGACVESLIGEIENENAKRKEQLQEHFEAVKREIEKQGEEAPTYDNRLIWMGKNLIIAQLRDLEDGIVGLLANRLADYYGLPVIVVSLGGQDAPPGTVKGSGRVRDSFNFFSCLEPLAGMFEKIGGHQQAFGFTARAALLPDIFRTLTSNIPDDSTGEKNHEIDAEVRVHEIQLGLVEELSRLEPHGNRNEEPIFLSRSVQVRKFDALGAGRKHAKLTVEDGATIEAIGWNMYGRIRSVLGLEEAQVVGFLYPRLDLVFRVEINDYNGSRKPRIVLVDFDRSDASELR